MVADPEKLITYSAEGTRYVQISNGCVRHIRENVDSGQADTDHVVASESHEASCASLAPEVGAGENARTFGAKVSNAIQSSGTFAIEIESDRYKIIGCSSAKNHFAS